jgi:hypothetical protein
VSIVERFSKNLDNIEYPSKKTSWNISGILKKRNSFHKFDVRDMHQNTDGLLTKKGSFKTEADKIVFETNKDWIIFDIEEIHKYIKVKNTKTLLLNDLISELEWTIFLAKN